MSERDIVERLRPKASLGLRNPELYMSVLTTADALEAADEITRLRAERDRLRAALVVPSPAEIRLHAGEMTAQEMRTVLAVLRWRAALGDGEQTR